MPLQRQVDFHRVPVGRHFLLRPEHQQHVRVDTLRPDDLHLHGRESP